MRVPCFTIIMICLLAVSASAQPTARQWNSEVTCGWNLGNQLECPAPGQDNESISIGCPDNALQAETAWGNPIVTKSMIDAVKAAGFNAIRIPVRWQCHITDPQAMTIDASWLQRVKEVVDYCIDNGMKVIINTHHEKWLESRPSYTCQEENNQRLALLWTQIGNAFREYDYQLAFAGTNEVHIPNYWNAPTAENQTVQNSYNQTFVNAVRATGGNNLKRHLIVQTYCCSLNFGLKEEGFVIPTDLKENGNTYMSVEFHYYTPWDYCGEATAYYWGEAYHGYDTVSANSEQDMVSDFQQATDRWASEGLGIVIGEWGVSDHWDKAVNMNSIHACMTYYCRTLVNEARKQGMSAFVWDNNVFGNGQEKFGIFDRWNGMSVKAKWIVSGICTGIAAGISPSYVNEPAVRNKARICFEKNRLLIRQGNNTHTLGGVPIISSQLDFR